MLLYFMYDGNNEFHDADDTAPLAIEIVPVVRDTGSCRVECYDDVEGAIWTQEYVPEDRPAPDTPLYIAGEIRLSDTVMYNREFMGLREVNNVAKK